MTARRLQSTETVKMSLTSHLTIKLYMKYEDHYHHISEDHVKPSGLVFNLTQ